jgi:hypothetical protein
VQCTARVGGRVAQQTPQNTQEKKNAEEENQVRRREGGKLEGSCKGR